MAWSPLNELVTLEQAKQHLKLPDYGSPVSAEDDDLQLKLLVAHEVVIDYLSQRISDQDAWQATVDAWTPETAPKRVLAAILAQFGYLYRRRGDDNDAPPLENGAAVCKDAEWLLIRFRDPALA